MRASRGRIALVYCDEAEFHLNPGLAHAWHRRGERLIVPSAGQNKRVPVFGALDARTGHVATMITTRKCSDDFIAFLQMLVDHVYADRRHVYLFLDNCSIHHTQVVREFLAARRDRMTVIWNAPYAPNLNLIERFWGHLKQNAFHNYFFGSVTQLESAIIQAVHALNQDRHHPLRLNPPSVQPLRIPA